ncbi:MAG: NnrS family protein [Chrysiogenetes bacterium]|nr:NnrS family protein [Chrysiogenetes bacterium]
MKSIFASAHPLWNVPYRPFFGFGYVWGVVLVSIWFQQLLVMGGVLGAPLVPRLLAADQHAHLMIWGLWGSFVCGFSLTAHVLQSGMSPPSRKWLRGVFALFALSQVLLVLAWTFALDALALPAKLGVLGAYAFVIGYSLKASLYRFRNSGFDARSAIFSLAMLVGGATLALYDFGPARLAWAAVHTALWGWLVMLVAVFGSLMTPILTKAASPECGASTAPSFLPVFLLLAWVLPGLRENFGAGAFAAGNAVWLLWCAAEWRRWKPEVGMRVTMLLPMHLGWIWLLASLLLAALRPFEDALHLTAINPTHLITLGCLGSFVFAVSSRIAQAHAGRKATLDRMGLVALGLLQLGALVRVFGALIAPDNPYLAYALAAALVLAAMLVWLAHYGRLLGARPSGPPVIMRPVRR